MGLKIPEIVFAQLDEAFGRTEPDEEIQDLFKSKPWIKSCHALPAGGAFVFDAVVNKIDAGACFYNCMVGLFYNQC